MSNFDAQAVVKDAIEASCGGDYFKTRPVIETLGTIIGALSPDGKDHPDFPAWAQLVCCRANLQIKINWEIDAVAFLEPLVQPGELLDDHVLANNSFANALIQLRRPEDAARHLEQFMGPIDAEHPDTVKPGAPDTCNIYAKALMRCDRYERATEFLWPLLQPGGILHMNTRSHNSLATALNWQGRTMSVIEHLEPLIRESDSFSRDPVSRYLLTKALYAEGKKDRALACGREFMAMARNGNLDSHVSAVAILLAVFHPDTQEVRAASQELLNTRGKEALKRAQKTAKRWRQESLRKEKPGPPTQDFYPGGVPTATVIRERLIPLHRGDRARLRLGRVKFG